MSRFIKMLTILSFLFSGQNIVAQESLVSDTSILKRLIKQAATLADTQLDSALILNRQICLEAAKTNLKQLVWDSRYKESELLFKLGYKDSALFILNNLRLQAISESDSLLQIKTYTSLANIQQETYDFKSAITNLLEAQKLLTNESPFDLRFDIINNLGQAHRKMKDYDSALKYYRILENDFYFQLSTKQKCMVFMNTGNVYASKKDYTKAEEFFQKAYEECQKLDEPDDLAQLTYNMGALSYRQKKYDKASIYIQKALDAYKEIKNQLYIERCYRVLGAIQYDQGNYENANQLYLTALEVAKQINNPKSIQGNLKNLFMSYQELAHRSKNLAYYAKALDYQNEWSLLKDSLYQTDLAKQLLELEKKFETDKKNTEIALLEKENQLKADELLLERKNQHLMWLGIALLLVVIVVVVYFMAYYRKVSTMLKQQSKLIFEQKEQITNQNVQLQKSVNTQNRLFSIIAHDLRSPLVSVANFVQLLNFYIADGNYMSIAKLAKDMDRKNEQVLELTDNLLNWAQSQSGALTPSLQRINLNEILDECYELYLPVAVRKGVALEFVDADDCLLWADRNMVRTICRNLVNNALKFTPKNGQVSISYVCNETEAQISVSDTGLGISPEKRQRLFSLEKEDIRHGTDGEKSSGLGLSVCNEFCRIMNGNIRVESTEGAGSKFSFSIPLYSEQKAELNPVQQEVIKSDPQ